MRIIIVGCGRTGCYMAKELSGTGNDVTVIDRIPSAFEKLGEDFTGNLIIGTGIDEDILIRAGIENADAVVSVAKGDNTNAMVGQIAKYLYKVPKVIVRISDPASRDFYEEKMGLICYCPTLFSANSFIKMIGEGK